MSSNSKIEWTEASWNVIGGCSRVSQGCTQCYSERLCATRLRQIEKYKGLATMTVSGPRWTNEIRLHETDLLIPLGWKKPRRIFVNSMSDTFHEKVPFEFIDKMFAVMALCPQHTFQILTKRPERMAEYVEWQSPQRFIEATQSLDLPEHDWVAQTWPIPNVWLGTSTENQAMADERIPHLLKCPAAVRFLSCEPLLGPINLTSIPIPPDALLPEHGTSHGFTMNALRRDDDKCFNSERFVDWVITGGESGPNARPAHPDWFRSLRDQCQAAGVAYFHKQNGQWNFAAGGCIDDDTYMMWPDGTLTKGYDAAASSGKPIKSALFAWRVPKKEAGRDLDGREWSEFPEVAHA